MDNKKASLTIDPFGGAIIDFHLLDSKINPLTFRFTKEQMPENNQSGAPYQGHFLCLGRWGQPSAGEMKAGIPDHGHFANMMWTCSLPEQGSMNMHAESEFEGLKVERTIRMDERLALYLVNEKITNVNPLGRLYNMVQHPTLAAPFLNHNTRIQSNASKGFHYMHYKNPEKYAADWPYGLEENKTTTTDLRFCNEGMSTVFSFIVTDSSRFGWITAYSPDTQLLLGYVWERHDYPWINIWKDWDKSNIKYCGLEFGTTGIHQPFMEILKQGKSTVFNTDTFKYLDAGEAASRRYISFLLETPGDIEEIESVDVHNGSLHIKHHKNQMVTRLNSSLIPDW